MKIQTGRGNFWIALDYISRVFMVEKENFSRVVKRKSQSQALDLLKIQQNNGCMVSQFLSNGRPNKIQFRHTKVLAG